MLSLIKSTGVWDGDATNDFVMPNEKLKIPSAGGNLTERELYDFGETCKLNGYDT